MLEPVCLHPKNLVGPLFQRCFSKPTDNSRLAFFMKNIFLLVVLQEIVPMTSLNTAMLWRRK